MAKKREFVPVLSVGIDVSKASLDVHCLHALQKTSWSGKVNNSHSGIQKLIRKLQILCIGIDTPIVMESTGDYHFLVAILLSEAGYTVSVLNPLASSKYCKAAVRKQKTDAIDAEKLAEIGILEGKNLSAFTLTRQIAHLRKKLNLLHSLKKKQQALKASLNSFQTTTEQLDQETSKANQYIQEAINSIEEACDTLISEIITLQKGTASGELIERMTTIPGISEKAASIIVSHITNVPLEGKKALIAFSGLDIETKQSGRFQGKQKLTKRGAPGLRRWAFLAAWGLVQHCDAFRVLYDYYRQKGRKHCETLAILARKFLKIVYGMMKNGTSFDPELVVLPKVA